MKRIGLGLVMILWFAGCATMPTEFTRIAGLTRTNFHGIRVYCGPVPEDFSYKSLGTISARERGWFSLQRYNEGLEAITLKAKEMGANAIIKWKQTEDSQEGEAVVFDKFPSVLADRNFKNEQI